jgi:glycosyltransferase involved in cell wall biosynthesis
MKNKKNLLVSSVIAAHNEEADLELCIKSLLKQSHDPLEIIIVENGESTDKTLEIAKDYAKKYKNIKALSLPGKQRGPGNAWNFGIKDAKGKIIHICGADLRYGKDYVKEGIKSIISGKNKGVVHNHELCANLKNLWARAFFKERPFVDEKGFGKVFTLVDKDYVKANPFDSRLGYADDQTIYLRDGIMFPGVEVEVYHNNPSSFKQVWAHASWVGKSMKRPLLVIILMPLLPLYAIYKTLKHLQKDFYLPFIFLPIYYSMRYIAYFKEAIKKIF